MLNIGGAVNVLALSVPKNLDGRVDTSYVLRQESHISSRSTSRMYDDNPNHQTHQQKDSQSYIWYPREESATSQARPRIQKEIKVFLGDVQFSIKYLERKCCWV